MVEYAINHRPRFNVDKVCEIYSKKDGVPVTYVCTSALGSESEAMDIFYRETPHPEFGNRYFGLYSGFSEGVRITNADDIELTSFDMIFMNNEYHYSQHRHDYLTVGNVSIDGGRAYTKLVGDVRPEIHKFVVKDGKFDKL